MAAALPSSLDAPARAARTADLEESRENERGWEHVLDDLRLVRTRMNAVKYRLQTIAIQRRLT